MVVAVIVTGMVAVVMSVIPMVVAFVTTGARRPPPENIAKIFKTHERMYNLIWFRSGVMSTNFTGLRN